VLFHDSAEEVPLGELARVQVGPYYKYARGSAARAAHPRPPEKRHETDRHDHGRQASALTLDDGRIYKNAFASIPSWVTQTLEKSAAAGRSGILIIHFMLASEPQPHFISCRR